MTRAKATLAIKLICGAASLVACSSNPAPPPASSVAAPVESAAPPPAAGVLDGPIGRFLSEADRAAAIDAQQDAVSSGTRKSWRGSRGVYGFVTPDPERDDCRDYTHRIFIDGRPKEAKGQACLESSQWVVKGS